MALNQPFTTASQALANYNFTDIAEGTGVLLFYGTESSNQTSGVEVNYRLISSNNTSESFSITATITAGQKDMNFDLTAFNLPKVVKGTAFISAGLKAASADGVYFTAQVMKWDGSSETNVSSAIRSRAVTGTNEQMNFFAIPLTETNFAAGDVLRLNIIMKGAGGSDIGDGDLGIDPAGRTFGTLANTQLKLFMPFKIDI